MDAFGIPLKSLVSLRFPQKLWKIINESNGRSIQWSKHGTTIIINYEQLKEEYLNEAQNTFKTTNVASFIRQLNLYGFRKLSANTRAEITGEKLNLSRRDSATRDDHEFYNAYFMKGRPDLLPNITRRTISEKMPRQRSSIARIPRHRANKNPSKNRLTDCQKALVDALECATAQQELSEINFKDTDCGNEESQSPDSWKCKSWENETHDSTIYIGSSPTTAEELLENIKRGIISSHSENDNNSKNVTEYSWVHQMTGNTPPTTYLHHLQGIGKPEYAVANDLGFGQESEIQAEDCSITWSSSEHQILAPMHLKMTDISNKENVSPRVIAQPIVQLPVSYDSCTYRNQYENWNVCDEAN